MESRWHVLDRKYTVADCKCNEYVTVNFQSTMDTLSEDRCSGGFQRNGRPRSTNGCDDRLVVKQALRNRRKSAELQQYLRRVRRGRLMSLRRRSEIEFTRVSLGHGVRNLYCCVKLGAVDQVLHGVHSGDVRTSISGLILCSVTNIGLPYCTGRRRVLRRAGERYTDR